MSLSVAATPTNLTRYLTETPASVEKSLTRKETLYSVAMKISALVAIALFAFPLCIAAGLISASWIGIPTTLGCFIAGMICTHGHATFEKRMQEAQFQKELYTGISNLVSKKITPGETKGIQEFLKKNKGSIEQIPQTTLTALTKINPTAPLDALKPLIIRYEEADVWPYGVKLILNNALSAATALVSKTDKKETRERLDQYTRNQATLHRLALHYAKQKKECEALLGLKA